MGRANAGLNDRSTCGLRSEATMLLDSRLLDIMVNVSCENEVQLLMVV